MHVLVAIALKSLLVAGVTLALLQLMKSRSAAERSWVAHTGLVALIVMAFAPLAIPSWSVEAPALLGKTAPESPSPDTGPATALSPEFSVLMTAEPIPSPAVGSTAVKPIDQPAIPTLSAASMVTAAYAVPAAVLLLITLIALVRLIALQARADVLVDTRWLSALARAQRRMGFKHGTALLTSDELASPISWGLMRPVILLNRRAVEASNEAEAIIAHELAHVARMDWVKLLLARIATALFWFNPLVWILAREAHQLREEAADDSVLAADIVDTDYAQLLVGVARHECPGLLLGAHGVAPSKGSLARRVARVLDTGSVRRPAARPFAMGVLAGALVMAAPLAALTLTPAAAEPQREATGIAGAEPSVDVSAAEPADLGHIIAKGVSASVSGAVAAATSAAVQAHRPATSDVRVESQSGALVESHDGTIATRSPSGATVTIYPPDANGRRKVISRSVTGKTTVSYADDGEVNGMVSLARTGRPDVRAFREQIKTLEKLGVTPEYVNAMRSAVPQLGNLEFHDFAGMRSVGVTPEFASALVAAGFPRVSADELVQARAIGVTGEYVRAMRQAGIKGDLDDFVQLRAVGVDPAFAARARASGAKIKHADDLIEMRVMAIAPPSPPRPPVPPRSAESDPDPDG